MLQTPVLLEGRQLQVIGTNAMPVQFDAPAEEEDEDVLPEKEQLSAVNFNQE